MAPSTMQTTGAVALIRFQIVDPSAKAQFGVALCNHVVGRLLMGRTLRKLGGGIVLNFWLCVLHQQESGDAD